MNSIKALLGISAAGLFASGVQAADGTINFTGEIVAASCVASAGAGSSVTGTGSKQVVEVNLGKVSVDTVTSSSKGAAGLVAGTAINLNLDCGKTAAGLTSVKFSFDPWSGSGVDKGNNNLLKTTGTATGVGIGMFDASSQLIKLTANEAYSAPLVAVGEGENTKYTASLNMRAAYVANGEEIKPGTANGTLPFTLTYE